MHCPLNNRSFCLERFGLRLHETRLDKSSHQINQPQNERNKKSQCVTFRSVFQGTNFQIAVSYASFRCLNIKLCKGEH